MFLRSTDTSGDANSTSPALNASSSGITGLAKTPSLMTPALSSAGSQIPWRRSNVRHTSNELYVDLVETLQVTFTPSGRPLAAFANGSIAFTSKVSGVPDLLLTLTTSGAGSTGSDRGDKVRRTMERPVFHPCVRLARWREHGEISFVPPDGRFVLAGYEVDLLDPSASPFEAKASSLNLPASIEVKTGLGSAGLDFEVRLTVNHRFSKSGGGGGGGGSSGGNVSATASLSNHLGRPGGMRTQSGESKSPVMEDVLVSVPIPAGVRNINDLRPSKGEAHWSPGDTAVEWRLGGKEMAGISGAGAVLRCSVVGAMDDDEDALGLGNGIKADTYDYDEDTAGAYQSGPSSSKVSADKDGGSSGETRDARRVQQNAVLMPTSASLSFSVKGWLASGLKVDSLIIDMKRSKGVGEGVRPYKGVKYLTVSKGGIEVRC